MKNESLVLNEIKETLPNMAKTLMTVLRDQVPLYSLMVQNIELKEQIRCSKGDVSRNPEYTYAAKDFGENMHDKYIDGGTYFTEPYYPVLGKFLLTMEHIFEIAIWPLGIGLPLLTGGKLPTTADVVGLVAFHLITSGLAGLNHQKELDDIQNSVKNYTK